MAPGVAEEVGQTGRSAITALGTNPVVLGLILFASAMLGINIYVVNAAAERWHTTLNSMLEEQKGTQALLLNCVPMDKLENLIRLSREPRKVSNEDDQKVPIPKERPPQ